ncbi:Hypothetical protein D9617_61g013200 [Elsinoe fawcettii]|nr:Hypothetical protein D9617_61g013200 [Elsinoe fawcettii]
MAGALIYLHNKTLLVVAAYDPALKEGGSEIRDDILDRKLRILQELLTATRASQHPQQLEILINSDFNRHHELWGGDRVAGHMKDGDQIVSFAQDMQLNSLLWPGITTWQYQFMEWSSTVHMLLASDGLTASQVLCKVADTDYGSDHWAIEAVFQCQQPNIEDKPRRLLFDKADWTHINRVLQTTLPSVPTQDTTKDGLEECANIFHTAITTTVQQHVPRARPSLYAER